MNQQTYQVIVKKKIERLIRSVPPSVRDAFSALIDDLTEKGPYQHDWPNYSPLGGNKYHCHLSYSYVACWQWEQGTIIIEVIYAGSRESAPYDTKKSQK
jgi:mRNA-degrading endonuclease RelE of RelBE toxin-antitoxin system